MTIAQLKTAATVLGLILVVVFLPFVLGGKTLLSSARDVSSVLPQGALGDSPAPNTLREGDPGAPAWLTEPSFAIEQRAMLRENVLPVWNPYSGFGAPLAADMQVQPYYPISFGYALFPSPFTYNIWVLLRLFVAGIAMFAFLRWHVSFYPAVLGAVATMLSGHYILHYNSPFLSVDVLLPALLFCVEYTLRKPGPRSLALTVAVAYSAVTGGMPESAILVFSFATLYGLFALVVRRAKGIAVARGALVLAGGLTLGIAASAIVLVPFIEFWHVSFNVHDVATGAANFPGTGANRLDAAIALFVAPLAFGPPRNNIFEGFSGFTGISGYFGSAVAFFALVAILDLVYRRLLKRIAATDAALAFFAVATAVLLAKLYGSPLVNWIGQLPGFRYVLFQAYEGSLLAISVVVCAAIGLERLLSGRVPSWYAATSAAAWLIAITVLETTFGERLASAVHPDYFEWAVATATVALVAAFLAALTRASSRERVRAGVLGPAAVVIVAAELSCNYILPMFYLRNPEPNLATNPYRGAPFVSYLQTVAPPGRWRVFGKDGYLIPNWAGVFGLANVTQLDALYHARYLPFVRAFLLHDATVPAELGDRYAGGSGNTFSTPLERRFLQLGSVRYVVAGKLSSGPSSPFKRLAVSDAPVYELSPVLSRATLFYAVEPHPSGDLALSALVTPGFDPFSRAVVEVGPAAPDRALLAIAGRQALPAEPATVTRYESTRVEIDAQPSRPALLMLNDLNYPGWTATVDGAAAPIIAADYLFRGVMLQPGRHAIVFAYDPPSLYFGKAISVLATFVTAAVVFAMVFRARRRRRDDAMS